MRTVKIRYLNNVPEYQAAELAIVTMLCMTSRTYLSYQYSWKFVLLTTFLKFLLPKLSVSANHKSDLFSGNVILLLQILTLLFFVLLLQTRLKIGFYHLSIRNSHRINVFIMFKSLKDLILATISTLIQLSFTQAWLSHEVRHIFTLQHT